MPMPRPVPGEEAAALAALLVGDATLMRLLRALRALGLPAWRLVSGCIYQRVWNARTGRPPTHGLADYDLAYFDGGDLSWAAEDAVLQRVAAATEGLGLAAPVQARNQARVHLWFADRFGIDFGSPLTGTDAALARYASQVHAVGVRLEPDGQLDIAAPFGLADVFDLVIRPNPALDNAAAHAAKAARALTLWPEARVLPWPTGACAAGPGSLSGARLHEERDAPWPSSAPSASSSPTPRGGT